MTRWGFDTEFNAEDNRTIDLISIAFVSESGEEYYACNREARLDLCGDWLRSNVLPKLPSYSTPYVWKDRGQIAKDLRELLCSGVTDPEIWGYFPAFDWVIFCQLFGGMLRLPTRIPKSPMDLRQRMKDIGWTRNELPPLNDSEAHSALVDARWTMDAVKATDAIWNKRPR